MNKVIHCFNNLKSHKVDMPIKIIRDNRNLFSTLVNRCFNDRLDKEVLPDELKNARAKLIYKNNSQEMIKIS